MRDSDVRKALHELIAAVVDGDPDTIVIDEMGVWAGTARIDVALVNGELSGFEIKSDRDTLDRLPYQAEIYGKIFDKLTLVVGARHAKQAAAIVPKWWGIIIAKQKDSSVYFTYKRRPRQNKNIDSAVLVQMLWKDEAIALLDKMGLSKGYRSKNLRKIQERILEHITESQLKNFVLRSIKSRKGWLRQQIAN